MYKSGKSRGAMPGRLRKFFGNLSVNLPLNCSKMTITIEWHGPEYQENIHLTELQTNTNLELNFVLLKLLLPRACCARA